MKKIIAGFLAMAILMTSVPTNVRAGQASSFVGMEINPYIEQEELGQDVGAPEGDPADDTGAGVSSPEEASDEEASDEEASDEEVSDEEASDEEASDEEASDEEVSDEEASDEEASDEEVSDEEMPGDVDGEEENGGAAEVPVNTAMTKLKLSAMTIGEPVEQNEVYGASFMVQWDDLGNIAERREDNLADLFSLYANGGLVPQGNYSITRGEPITGDDGIETVTYKIEISVSSEGEGTENPAEKISYTLDLNEGVLPGYFRRPETPEAPETLSLIWDETAECYKADGVFTYYLPAYTVKGTIQWPQGMEPSLENFGEFTVKLNRANGANGENGVNGEDYTTFKASVDENWNFELKGLFDTDKDGNRVTYTVSAPTVGELVTDPESITVPGQEENITFTYKKPPVKTTVTVSSETSKEAEVVWYDRTGTDSNEHPGELELSIPYKIGETESSVSFTWDSVEGKYIHNWTEAEIAALGLPADQSPLVLEDKGDNSLNRTLSIEKLPEEIKVVKQKLGEDGNPVYDENNEPVAEETTTKIAWGDILVADVKYEKPGDIVDYEIRKDNEKNSYIMMPIRDVVLNLDVRSGDDTKEEIIEYLEAYMSIAFEMSIKEGNAVTDTLNWEAIKKACFGEEGWSVKEGAIHLQLPVYSDDKKELVYSFRYNVEKDENKTVLEELYKEYGFYYRTEYDNTSVHGHGTDTEQAYADGTCILIKTGEKDYNATKYWYDELTGEAIEERPNASYTLWRYTLPDGDYTMASQVTIVDEKGKEKSSWDMPKQGEGDSIEIPIGFEDLPKYNADGYEYVYFIRETLNSSKYEKIYGHVATNGTITAGTDPLPYEGKRKEDDTSIYDEGSISNKRTEPISVTATKNWKAAYYQDELEDIAVELTLYARHKTPKEEDGYEEWTKVGETKVLDGFDAAHTSQTVSASVDRYDAHGHELEYMWLETGIRQTDVKNGDAVFFEKTSDGKEETVDITNIVENIPQDDESSDVSYTFRLPMNQESIEKDSCAHSDEYFESKMTVDGDRTIIDNTLKGTTDYYVKKEWDYEPDGDVEITLTQISADGTKNSAYDSYVIPKNSDKYKKTGEGETARWSTDWIDAFCKIPRYDENGNLYSYIATEVSKGFYTYGFDVDGDKIIEENSVSIVNSKKSSDTRVIDIRKVWLDDSATAGRNTVKIAVYTEDGVLVYGTIGEEEGVISDKFVELSRDQSWWKEIGVSLYYEVNENGDPVTGEDGKKNYVTSEEREKYPGKNWEFYGEKKGGFYIKEAAVGENFVSSAPEDKVGGYDTVTSNGTKYAVLYYTKDENDNWIYSPDKTDVPDDMGDYVVTNLRVGTLDLKVTKKWVDNIHTADRPEDVYFKLTCTEYPGAVSDEEVQNGYVEIPNHPLKLQQSILDNANTNVSSRQKLATTEKKEGGTWETTEEVYFYNLPLYDGTGKIIHYQIQEEIEGKDNKDYIGSSGSVVYNTADSGNTSAGKMTGEQTVTNQPSRSKDVEFYMLWLDEYRKNSDQRPDVYLTLYYTKYDDAGKATIVPYDFKEYLWNDVHENNEQITEDHWKYTFKNMPMYDSKGNKITYYAAVNNHADKESIDYIDAQYAAGQIGKLEDFQKEDVNQSTVSWDENGNYQVTHKESSVVGTSEGTSEGPIYVLEQENTFVFQLKEDIHINGHKTWEKLPEGFPAGELPKLTFKLYRDKTSRENPNVTPLKDEVLQNSEDVVQNGVLVAAIVGYQSTDLSYDFKMQYMGLNTENGELIDKGEKVTVNGETKTAGEIWLELLGLENAAQEVKNAALANYGSVLPKYDEAGAMYVYSVVETIAETADGRFDVAYKNLNGATVGYNITNTYNREQENTRQIELSKLWEKKPADGNGSPVEEGFIYPDTTYTLYRFYESKVTSKTYSAPEQVASVTLKAEDAAAGKVNFGEQLIYAPNGKPYIYYIGETKVDGYGDPTFAFVSGDNGAEEYSEPVGAVNWPGDIGKLWYTKAFRLKDKTETENEGSAQILAKLSDTNTYNGGTAISISGDKIWEDYDNVFNTRPKTLTLTLYREAEGISKQELATVTLNTAVGGETTVTLAKGVVNLNGTISATTTANDNTWSYVISGLDSYASNGKPWKYSVVETVPTNYTGATSTAATSTAAPSTAVGTDEKALELSKLVNNSYTEFAVEKKWLGVNQGIELPEVQVELQISPDGGMTWHWASDYFANEAHKITYTDVTKTLNHANGWKATYTKLPIGYTVDGSYQAFTYRIREIKIGVVEVQFTENSDGSRGTEYANSNGTSYEIGSGENTNAVVTNTPTNKTKLTVTKLWVDDKNNDYGTRGDVDGKEETTWSVQYHVYREYTPEGSEKVTEILNQQDGKTPYVLTIDSKSQNVKVTLDNLPARTPAGEVYKYYAVELDVKGNELKKDDSYNGGYIVDNVTNAGSSEGGYTTAVTNRLETVELTVTKNWEDGSFGKRPAELTFTLYQKLAGTDGKGTDITKKYGEAIMTGSGDSWTYTYTGLPKYNTKKEPYIYHVVENRQPGYEDPSYTYNRTAATPGTGEENKQTETITNTLTEFTLNKVDEDNTATKLNHVKLVFVSTSAIDGHYYKLTWERDADGKESYTILQSTGNTNDFTGETEWSSGSAGSGSVTIKGLPVGTYRLTEETTIPNGYLPSALNGSFTLEGNGTITAGGQLSATHENGVTLTVKDKKTSLSFTKKGKDEVVILPAGYSFSVTGQFRASDSTLTDKGEVRYLGKVPASGGELLEDGDLVVGEIYALYEVETPDYYVPCTTTVYFKMLADGTVQLVAKDGQDQAYTVAEASGNGITFKNKPFEVTLKKTDNSTPAKSLGGAVFKLQEKTAAGAWNDVTINDTPVTVTTSGNGSVTLNSVTHHMKVNGAYRLEETKAPDGYILPDTHPYVEFTVGVNGKISITQSSSEVDTSGAENNSITVRNAPIDITLTKLGGKYDLTGDTPLAGVTFRLTEEGNPSKGQTAVTDRDGKLTFGPASGANSFKVVGGKSYILSEEIAGHYGITIKLTVATNGKVTFEGLENMPDYTLDDGKIIGKDGTETGKVVVGDDKTSLTLTNVKKLGSVTLTKKDGDDRDEKLNDVTFTLHKKKGADSWFEKVINFITGKQYTVAASFDWEGTVDGTDNAGITVTDGADGVLTIKGLEWGDYKLVETRTLNGYVPLKQEFTFTIDADNVDSTMPLEIGNKGIVYNYKNELRVKKTDSSAGEALSGAVFKLYQGESTTGDPYKSSDKNGSWDEEATAWVLRGLPVGTYTLVETKAPDGYAKPDGEDAELTFTVNEDGTITGTDSDYFTVAEGTYTDGKCQNVITMKDKKINVTLTKKSLDSSNTAEYLPGTEFEVSPKEDSSFTDETVNLITITSENYETALNGQLIGGNSYGITETKAPDGHTMPETAFTLVVAENGSMTLTPDDSSKLNGAVITEAVSGNLDQGFTVTIQDAPLDIVLKKVDDAGTAVANAVFTLTDQDEPSKTWNLTSDANGYLHMDGRTDTGSDKKLMKELQIDHTYILTETMPSQSPYVELAPIEVTLNKDGTLTENADAAKWENKTLTITNTRTSFTLDKIDAEDTDTKKKLKNVSLTFTGVAGVGESVWSLVWTRNTENVESYTVKEGEAVRYQGTETAGASVAIRGLPVGTYTLSAESIIPNGYASAAGLGYKLKIAENGAVTVEGGGIDSEGNAVTVKDTKQELTLKKVDAANQPITGSGIMVFEITGKFRTDDAGKEDGTRYITAENNTLPEAYRAGALKAGELVAGETYTLTEKVAPAGYLRSTEEVTFKMDKDGSVIVLDGKGVAEAVSGKKACIQFRDEPFQVAIEKKNMDGEPIDASFALHKYNGTGWTLVSNSIATTNGVISLGSLTYQLEAGGQYYLTETAAQNGYILNPAKIYFSIDDQGRLTEAGEPITELEDYQSIADNELVSIDGSTMTIKNKPINIALTKYDGSYDGKDAVGTMANVEFSLQEVTSSLIPQKATTDKNGVLRFGPEADDHTFAVAYGRTYRLTETAKTGYYGIDEILITVGSDGKITFADKTGVTSGTDGSAVWEGANNTTVVIGSGGTDVTVTNVRKTGSVQLTKKDSTDSSELEGITFTLYRKDTDGSWFRKLIDFITGKQYKMEASFDWTGEGTVTGSEDTSVTVTDGMLIVTGLEWGDYKLVETAADGYILAADEKERTYEFTIDAVSAESGTHLLINKNGVITNDPNYLSVWKVDKDNHTAILPGAVYELTYTADSNGTAVNKKVDETHWSWDSDTGKGEANRLAPGTYTLSETTPPSGYKVAPDLVFTVDAFGTVLVNGEEAENLIIYAEDEKTRFSFTKLGLVNESCADPSLGSQVPDPEETKFLAGTEFTVYEDEALTKPVMSAVSDENGIVTFIGLPLGNYYVCETDTADGYVLDDTVYTVEITSEDEENVLKLDGEKVTDNTLVNDVYRTDITFTKVSELDKAQVIAGGVYGLYRDNMLIAKSTSDQDGKVTFQGILMGETYTVHELEVPAGSYLSAKPVKFTFWLNENGEPELLELDTGNGTVENTQNGILWLEPQTIVSILKTDEQGKALDGATLRILDEDGNVVKVRDSEGREFTSWISGKEPMVITGCLAAGETYYLEEVEAPNGYHLAEPVKFTLSDSPVASGSRNVISVVMLDKRIHSNAQLNAPQTGDSAHTGWAVAGTVLSLLGIGVCLKLLRRHRRR